MSTDETVERQLLRQSLQWLYTLHGVYRHRGNMRMFESLKEHIVKVEAVFPHSDIMLEVAKCR